VDIVQLAHRRDAHADAIPPPDRHQGLGDLEQQPRPVFYQAAICVGAPIGAGLDELIEQIAVSGMDLDAVEIGGLCVPGRALILSDDVGHLFDIQCTRPHKRNKFTFAALVFDEGFALGYDGGRRDREHVVGLQRRMRDAPDVPKLIEDQSVGLAHRLGDPVPRFHLLTAVDAGGPGVTLALHRYLRGLAHDQSGGGALRIVAGGKGARHIARLACPRAGQWRHHDAMA